MTACIDVVMHLTNNFCRGEALDGPRMLRRIRYGRNVILGHYNSLKLLKSPLSGSCSAATVHVRSQPRFDASMQTRNEVHLQPIEIRQTKALGGLPVVASSAMKAVNSRNLGVDRLRRFSMYSRSCSTSSLYISR